MGLGELGRDAARKLKAIGFDVAGWSASAKSEPGVACFHGSDGLDAMLARTDILVALLPLTAATRGILNARLFAKLARDGRLGGPILLNAGRGGLQNEADILAALDAGVLKGASLDVFEKEPLPRESPLWTHPAVFVSPHNAAISVAGRGGGLCRRADRGVRARRGAAQCGGSGAGVLESLRSAGSVIASKAKPSRLGPQERTASSQRRRSSERRGLRFPWPRLDRFAVARDSTALGVQGLVEVRPGGIVGLDQRELLGAAAGLDLLFPRNGLVHTVIRFEPSEKLASIMLGESLIAPTRCSKARRERSEVTPT